MNKIRYTDVEISVVQRIVKSISDLERLPVLISHKSDHPEDIYLYLVMGENRNGSDVTYDVWTYNDSSQSLNGGAYGLTFSQALNNMGGRIHESNSALLG